MPYAKNNQDPTHGSPMLGLSVGPTLLTIVCLKICPLLISEDTSSLRSLKSLPQLVRKLLERLITAIASQPTDMWKLLALLPRLLLVAEVKGNCSELLACKNIISDRRMNTAEALDQECAKLSNHKSCITDRLDTCDNSTVKKDVRIFKDIMEFMCRAANRPLVLRTTSLDCYQNSSMQDQITALVKLCLYSFKAKVNAELFKARTSGRENESIDACKFVYDLGICWLNKVTPLCNIDMGILVVNIWIIKLADLFAEFGCPQDVTQSRRYVKRALPMLSKRLAAISKLKLKR
ncbi:hypothetical protein PoB_000927200 [Plakobranchus ocellatus]|uniref:Uncharacterized protein n=1 Tax=Plakobranchus ocellatus TaxID=259542 RepID=A0AAV3YK45_9GAST|nr:hypothetical protein PoB_000927200 [Plakobranchus ocellatus]